MVNLNVNLGKISFKNPVLTASGTFGYGEEFADFIDLNRLGGIIVKGTTLEPRQGNDYPRMAETPSGMLNAVGLQNKGVDYFISETYPNLTRYNHTNFIVNVSGSKVEDYAEVCRRIEERTDIKCVEINISCPNVKQGGMAFGTTAHGAAEVTKAVRRAFTGTVIMKLSPNVTDITEIARAVESEGADAVSMINTLMGMAIDVERRRPKLSTVTGGLSGPAVRPVAVRMVWQTYKAVKIPIIGLGDIMNASDALEFIMAGASAVEIGTANFVDPRTSVQVIEGIEDFCTRHNVCDINELIGCIH